MLAWFGNDNAAPRVLYSQANRYDAADRLIATGRRLGGAGARAAEARSEHYDYDRHDQLTGIVDHTGAGVRYTYDKGGNRTEARGAPRLLQASADGSNQAPAARGYLYAQGSNRLIGVSRLTGATEGIMEHGLFYRPGGLPMAQIGFTKAAGQLGTAGSSSGSRRIA